MKTKLLALLALVALSGCHAGPTNDPHLPVTLTIKAKESDVDPKADIIVVCEFRNVSEKPLVLKYGDPTTTCQWVVDDCYTSFALPPWEPMMKEVAFKPQETFGFEVLLKHGDYCRVHALSFGNKPVRDRSLMNVQGVSDHPAFTSKKKYRIRAETSGWMFSVTNWIQSNEITVRIR